MRNDETENNKDYINLHLESLTSGRPTNKDSVFVANYQGYLRNSKNLRILEIGPGLCEVARYIFDKFPDIHYEAVDISPVAVNHCNKLRNGSAILTDDVLKFLDSQQGNYDIIMAFHVLEHIAKDKLQYVAQAIYGALKPGGVVLLEVPNMANPITAGIMRHGDLTHESGFTSSSLGYLIKAAGFDKIDIWGTHLGGRGIAKRVQKVLQGILIVFIRFITFIFWPRPEIFSVSLSVSAAKAAKTSSNEEKI